MKRIAPFLPILIGALTIFAFILIACLRQPSGAQEPSIRPDGAIPIAPKYLAQFESAIKEYEQAQATMRAKQDEIEQIGRLTLDLAGVPPAEFHTYNLDGKEKILKKKVKEQPRANP